ncbi:hypothetical protein BJY00DRAFT_233970 [Aspergillus carlsbadensis]|nr:hypothetical protein BJY00DRAFT_233970 [Aspergillus carlsbadensis]
MGEKKKVAQSVRAGPVRFGGGGASRLKRKVSASRQVDVEGRGRRGQRWGSSSESSSHPRYYPNYSYEIIPIDERTASCSLGSTSALPSIIHVVAETLTIHHTLTSSWRPTPRIIKHVLLRDLTDLTSLSMTRYLRKRDATGRVRKVLVAQRPVSYLLRISGV